MSFCADVKHELCEQRTSSRCCRRAECAGLTLGVKLNKREKLTFRTASEETAQLAQKIFAKFYGESSLTQINNGKVYKLESLDTVTPEKLISPEGILSKTCCRLAFIKGAFLSCGQLANPRTEYRLDFNVCSKETAVFLFNQICECGFSPRISHRSNGTSTVYFKDGASIEDFLTYIGAAIQSLSAMEIRVEKDYKNHINRTTNFDTANYVRAFSCGKEQLEAIGLLEKRGVLATLPLVLQQTAQLRVNNTDASLKELSEISGINRSSLNHRLKRLVELSKEEKD